MKNTPNCILYGDSISYEYAHLLEQYLQNKINSFSCSVLNMSVSGETSSDGLVRLEKVANNAGNIIIISFGMNDWRKGITPPQYKDNILQMIHRLRSANCRIILTTITPDWNGSGFALSRESFQGTSPEIDQYNNILWEIGRKEKIRIADANGLWKERVDPIWEGLKDAIHPNTLGQEIICESLYYMISRDHITIVWPFYGRFASCNYSCQYCYVPTSVNKGSRAIYSVKDWEKGFIRSFGEYQRLTFY
ncbi:uncharacterized protein METZ01_LOCUS403022, partial [marine metagenome]